MKSRKFFRLIAVLLLLTFVEADFFHAHSTLLKVPNFCNDCSINGCLNDGKCRSDDGRCDCPAGFWGNRCQYKAHEMYKFGQCPTLEVVGKKVYDWPQLQPDGCYKDSDCPGLWKCCPSLVSADGHHDDYSPAGTRSCTQPYLAASLVPQLPLCLQHLWNITDSGRTFSGCDVLMCDDSTGGRAFDRWQCNYCDANSSTCFCFINFDNEGKYWGELPGSRQRLNVIGETTTDRPGVIHRMPKHECSLQDRCPQMFPHTIYCSHGIQRDSSGCPTGECLPNPEEKCFTPCSAGFLCEHRPEPEQVNQWHCIDTFRQFRVSVPLSSRIASALVDDLDNVSAKAAELVALHAIVDESILALLSNSSTLPCDGDTRSSALRATTAANAYLLQLRDDPAVSVVEIVGQVAFSANFSGQKVRRQLQHWINETYWSKMVEMDAKMARSSREKPKLSVFGIAVISATCVVIFLAIVIGVPLIVFRRRLFPIRKQTFSTANGNLNHQQQITAGGGVFSAFTNPTHRYGTAVFPPGTALSPISMTQEFPQEQQQQLTKLTKSRLAPLPPSVTSPLPEINAASSSSPSSSSSNGSRDGAVSTGSSSEDCSNDSVTMSPNAVANDSSSSDRQTSKSTGATNEGFHSYYEDL